MAELLVLMYSDMQAEAKTWYNAPSLSGKERKRRKNLWDTHRFSAVINATCQGHLKQKDSLEIGEIDNAQTYASENMWMQRPQHIEDPTKPLVKIVCNPSKFYGESSLINQALKFLRKHADSRAGFRNLIKTYDECLSLCNDNNAALVGKARSLQDEVTKLTADIMSYQKTAAEQRQLLTSLYGTNAHLRDQNRMLRKTVEDQRTTISEKTTENQTRLVSFERARYRVCRTPREGNAA